LFESLRPKILTILDWGTILLLKRLFKNQNGHIYILRQGLK
jgi:hypothetical protein